MSGWAGLTGRGKRLASSHSLAELHGAVMAALSDLDEGLIVFDILSGDLIFANDAFRRISGYGRDDLAELESFWGLFPPLERSAIRERLERCRAAGSTDTRFSTAVQHKDGHRVDLEVSAKFIPGRDDGRAVAVVHDITDRRRAELAVRHSEARFRSMVQNSSDIIALLDGQGRILYESPAIERVLGYPPEALIGRDMFEYIHPDDVAAARRAFEAGPCLPPGTLLTLELRCRHADGSWRTLELTGSNWQQEPAVGGIVINARDITERKRAESALAAEKERLAVTLRSIGEAVIATDTQGRVVMLNRAAETLTGWTKDDAEGRPLGDVFRPLHEHTRQPNEDVMACLAREGVLNCQAVLISRDGTLRHVSGCAAQIATGGGEIMGAVLALADVTERRRIEDELQRADKLETVGVLAGGIAHDFNNLLTVILANLSMARLSLAPSDSVYQRLSEAERACYRAHDLTQRLLTFSRGGAPVRRQVDLGSLVREHAELALTGSNVRADFDIPPTIWPVEADPGQIGQLIQNLVLNAQQAMPEGGTIRIRLDNTEVRGDEGLPQAPGPFIRLVVADHGPGIPVDVLPKIFDPFFSTKSNHAGLGLAAAYSIVRRHGGHVSVTSALSLGTTLIVHLPARPPDEERQAAGRPMPLASTPVRRRILAMDDDEAIRHALHGLLTQLGHDVTLAPDGAAAVDLYRCALEAERRFDLVILDLTVPGGQGARETLPRLRRLDPAVVAIVSTGYGTDPIMREYARLGFRRVVAKPYSFEELARAVREALPDLTAD